MNNSVEKLDNYLYRVKYDSIPIIPTYLSYDYSPSGCSSFVKGGKLYRNLDFNYTEAKTFIVECPSFKGIAFGDFKDADILPFRIVDGVNDCGIKVCTHILFNDWNWQGDGGTPLFLLPFIILRDMEKIEDISKIDLSQLSPVESLGDYIAQYLVTDGETTYVITPTENGYIYVDATDNPKLSNFKWTSESQVTKDILQERPTGIERWNMMPCELKDLSFTKAYEKPIRLSEFIGENDTTKYSSDSELLDIYKIAHEAYENRTRDGKTWHTMHSVVYGDHDIEHLYIQEDWGNDYASIELNNNSILLDIKKFLGITPEYTYFDNDVITHTNTVLLILHQIGIGDKPFSITGETEKWTDFIGNDAYLELVKSYIYAKVRMIFDPPTVGALSEAMKNTIDELEWRISVTVDPESSFKKDI